MNALVRAVEALRDADLKYVEFFPGGYEQPDFVVYWNFASPPNPRCTFCVWFVPTFFQAPSWECD